MMLHGFPIDVLYIIWGWQFIRKSLMGKIITFIAVRPFTFFILLTIVLLTVPSIMIPYWYNNMMKKIERNIEEARFDTLTKIQLTTKFLPLAIIQIKAHDELAFPCKEMVNNVNKHMKDALTFLVIWLITTTMAVLVLVSLIVREATREVHRSTVYMKQMGKTVHDIRGYLACIKGWIDMSFTHLAHDSELGSNLNKIDICVDDVLGFVNSILDYNKIEAGKMQLNHKEFDMDQLVQEITDIHCPNAMKKGITLILDRCDGSIMNFSKVIGDEVKIKQILNNLLSNAVKFTSQGHISIRVKAKKPEFASSSHPLSTSGVFLDRVMRFFSKSKQARGDSDVTRWIREDPRCMEYVFEVEDTGRGIPMEKRRSIFDDFVQVKDNNNCDDDGVVGTGLGLGIARSLARLMGGDVKIVDKANEEAGTCFKFNILLIVPGLSKAPPVRLEETSEGGESTEKALEGKRFLIAEDNAMLRKLAATCVARWGATHTRVCGNGKEALEVVCRSLSEMLPTHQGSSSLPFDYVLMDCQMPVMDGLEATRRIREEERKYGVRIPIIALTAENEEEEEGKKLKIIVEAGMDGYLTKPLKIDCLMEAIKALSKTPTHSLSL